jgi:hypothetical protein
MLSSSTAHDADRGDGRKVLTPRHAKAVSAPVSRAAGAEGPVAATSEAPAPVQENRKVIHKAPEQVPQQIVDSSVNPAETVKEDKKYRIVAVEEETTD